MQLITIKYHLVKIEYWLYINMDVICKYTF